MSHPALDLGLVVIVMADTAAWELGVDELDTTTKLGASTMEPGNMLDLSCDLVEATWTSGVMADTAKDVLPLPEAGTMTARVVDPRGLLLPTEPWAGVRPGRDCWLYDRGTGVVLWTGRVEALDLPDDSDPLGVVTLHAVDTITRVAHSDLVTETRPVETAAQRAQWVADTYFPDVPIRVDAAASSEVAALTAPQDPWEALRDAWRAEAGWMRVDRAGGLTLSANVIYPAAAAWDGVWSYRRAAGQPAPGEIRVEAMPQLERYRVLLRGPAGSGTGPGPTDTIPLGERLWVEDTSRPDQSILGVIESSVWDPTTLDMDVVLIAQDAHWTPHPATGARIRVRMQPVDDGISGVTAWVMPECSGARVTGVRADLLLLRNRWLVQPRGQQDAPYERVDHAASVATYGPWTVRLDSYPVPDAAGAARIAALGVSAWGGPAEHAAEITLNVTAGMGGEHGAELLAAVRDLHLSDLVETRYRGSTSRGRVMGWQWTWSGAGGLTGTLALSRAYTAGADAWRLGVVDHGELGRHTVLV